MKIFRFILMNCLVLASMTACEKDTVSAIFSPEVTTGTATNIYRMGATLSGNIHFTKGSMAERYGIQYSTLANMAEYDELEITDGATEFSIPLQNLIPGKTYYFCTYAYSGYSLCQGEVRSFTTTENNAPIFNMPVVSAQTATGFTISASLFDDGGTDLLVAGFCYNELGEEEPNFFGNVVNVDLGSHSLTAEITGLEPGKNYQVRAYAANENGLAYSEMLYVTTEQVQ